MAANTLDNWLRQPRPQYYATGAIIQQWGPYMPVMPQELPPTRMTFPTAWDNKMLNIPGQNVFQLYHGPRSAYAASIVGQRS